MKVIYLKRWIVCSLHTKEYHLEAQEEGEQNSDGTLHKDTYLRIKVFIRTQQQWNLNETNKHKKVKDNSKMG